jgi:hypothetical protein
MAVPHHNAYHLWALGAKGLRARGCVGAVDATGKFADPNDTLGEEAIGIMMAPHQLLARWG